MNFTVNSQKLAVELRLLNRIVPSKPVIAILSHVLMTAKDDLQLYATDLEIGLRAQCTARVDVPGSIALPVAKILAMVEQFTDGDVNILLDKNHVFVKCGSFKARLQAMPVIDFPDAPQQEDILTSVFDMEAFRKLIIRTRYAVHATGSRHVLHGALLTVSGPAAAMVATDGKRLALATTNSAGADLRIVIPAKALDIITSQIGEEIALRVGSKHLFFQIGKRVLDSRMIDGVFPQYERIVPRNHDKTCQIDRLAFTSALRRVLIAAEENSAIYFAISSGILELSSTSVEVGSADEIVPLSYEGPPLKICINGKYVLDFLEVSTGNSIVFTLKDENSAALLTDGTDHIGVVMLMRDR